MAATAETAPAPPIRWPTIDFGEVTATRYAASPNADLIARVSVTSFSGVDVPCATMRSMSEGERAAAASARRIASDAPATRRFGSGDVERVRRECGPDDLAQDAAPRVQRVLRRLDDRDGAALAQQEPVAFASNGRDAFVGSALRFDNAPMFPSAATATGRIGASVPPAMTTSASPARIRRSASW